MPLKPSKVAFNSPYQTHTHTHTHTHKSQIVLFGTLDEEKSNRSGVLFGATQPQETNKNDICVYLTSCYAIILRGIILRI